MFFFLVASARLLTHTSDTGDTIKSITLENRNKLTRHLFLKNFKRGFAHKKGKDLLHLIIYVHSRASFSLHILFLFYTLSCAPVTVMCFIYLYICSSVFRIILRVVVLKRLFFLKAFSVHYGGSTLVVFLP